MKKIAFIIIVALSILCARAQTAFTYQGQLSDGAGPANGPYDFEFRVFDAAINGAQLGLPNNFAAVAVSNGVFSVRLDFGNVFPGGAQRWLAISVKTNNAAVYTTLDPRQEITAAPYAITAGAVKAAAITSTMLADGAVTTAKLGANSITTDKIAAGAIKLDDIDDAGAAAYADLQHDLQPLGAHSAIPISKLERVVTTPNPASLTLLINGAQFGTLLGFTGEEAISENFHFVAQVRHTGGLPNLDTQIGTTGAIRFVRNARTNQFVGVVTGITLSSADNTSRLFTVRIESYFSALRHTTTYEVYQNINVVDLFKVLLNGYFVNFENKSTPIIQDMHIQYNETDYDFLNRVAENYGYYYFFDQANGAFRPVLADTVDSYRPIDPTSVPYYGDVPSVKIPEGSDYITHFKKSSRRTTLRTTASAYHFQIPTSNLLASSAGTRGAGEDFEFGQALQTGDPANVQKAFQTMPILAGVWQARNNLEAIILSGGSTLPDFRPGFTFNLSDQTASAMDGAYVLTRVTHSAQLRTVNGVNTLFYGNEFEAIPATVPFRPERKTPRPHAHPNTAVVTGPVGEKIYTDSFGRVKIQFHWDRNGKKDENSSAWVRVAGFSAGKDHGAMFLPEVGDEVLVSFINGDPDQPVVTGSLYNAANMPAYALPANRSRSTIRTKSTGGGINELRFEDSAGREELSLNAAKNLFLDAPDHIELNAPVRFNGGATYSNLLSGQIIAGSVTTGFEKQVVIPFAKAFASAPKVLVNAQNDPGFPNVSDTFAVSVRSVTTTSCTVNIVRVDQQASWAQNLRLNWMAWE